MSRPSRPPFRAFARPVAGLVTALLVLTATAAVADDLEVLDDQLVVLSDLDFGTVCVGDQVHRSIVQRLVRAGNGQVFANGSLFSITPSSLPGVFATATTGVLVPANWHTGNQSADNGKTVQVDGSVSLDTSTPRVVDGVVTYTATGPRQPDTGGGSGPAMATTELRVTGTVEDCAPVDDTPPVIEVVLAPPVPDGTGGWWVSDVSVTWTVTDPESDVVIDEGCVDQVIGTDGVHDLTCTATSAGGTSTATVTVQRDATAPTITATVTPGPNADGWHNETVTVTFDCDDALSQVVFCPSAVDLDTEGADQFVTGVAIDAAGNTAEVTVGDIDIDLTDPTITGSATPPPNANGWNNEPVDVTFDCDDALSGLRFCGPDVTVDTEGADQSVTGTAVDLADNLATFVVFDLDIDLTAPEVALVGGPQDGATYFPHEVPDVPTCDASDALSGLAGPCTVDDGWSDQVGTHTIVATATDLADNVGTAEVTYEVVGYTLEGFLRPVDDGINVIKGGRTVPLKFRVFADDQLISDTAVVEAITLRRVACAPFVGNNEIEDAVATGGTDLRWDADDQQFVFNWQTPSTPDQCREVSVRLLGGQTISAIFRLR